MHFITGMGDRTRESINKSMPDHVNIGQRRPADDEGYEQDIFQQRMATRRTYNQIATLMRQKAQKAGLNATQVTDMMEFINVSHVSTVDTTSQNSLNPSRTKLSPADMLIDLKMHLHHIENDILHRLLRIFVRHPDTNVSLYILVAIHVTLCTYFSQSRCVHATQSPLPSWRPPFRHILKASLLRSQSVHSDASIYSCCNLTFTHGTSRLTLSRTLRPSSDYRLPAVTIPPTGLS